MSIILASASPRRKELLKTIVQDFDVIPSNVDETYPSNLDSMKVSLYISDLKANDIHKLYPNDVVIGSDTAIVLDGKIIGKPKNKEEAKNMLLSFSNRMHYVTSGVTVYYGPIKFEINSINKVYFKDLSEAEIDEYLTHDEYKDKAGSYAIQGLANKFIDHYEGEFESIVGLPIKELKNILVK